MYILIYKPYIVIYFTKRDKNEIQQNTDVFTYGWWYYFIIFACLCSLHFFQLTEINRNVELYRALQISTVNTDKGNSMLLPNTVILYYLRFTECILKS